jgi:hypothetical protein
LPHIRIPASLFLFVCYKRQGLNGKTLPQHHAGEGAKKKETIILIKIRPLDIVCKFLPFANKKRLWACDDANKVKNFAEKLFVVLPSVLCIEFETIKQAFAKQLRC